MVPTIDVGDRLITTKESDPERGDMVVLHPPAGAADSRCGARAPLGAGARPTPGSLDRTFVERVVAAGRRSLSIRDGLTVIDGQGRASPRAQGRRSASACNLPANITVPAGHVFVMGDNRGASDQPLLSAGAPVGDVEGEVRPHWPVGEIGDCRAPPRR